MINIPNIENILKHYNILEKPEYSHLPSIGDNSEDFSDNYLIYNNGISPNNTQFQTGSDDKNLLLRINESFLIKREKEEEFGNGPEKNIISNNYKFVISKKIPRGQKIQINNAYKKNYKVHSKTDLDNVIRKVQVHFISFIINLSNDIIRTILGNRKRLKFINIDYKIKQIINYEHLKNLKDKNIEYILKKNVSPKSRSFRKYHNRLIYCLITKYSNKDVKDYFKAYSEINYLKLFKIYYETRTESKHKIEINGKEIKLSDKTKFFDELLNKYNDNKIMQKLLINYTKRAYFSIKETNKRFSFIVKK